MSTSSSWAPVTSMALRMDGERVWLLDQRRLPDEERWVDATDPLVMEECIRTLAVRGAPLIGVAGAYGLALAMRRDAGDSHLADAHRRLNASRPTAVNLRWALDRLRAFLAPLPPAPLSTGNW